MTRRTRRNLSNRKIKRIVKNQINASQSQISLTANSSNILFTRFIPLILLILIVLWGYSLLKDTQLLEFDSFAESVNGSAEPLDNPTTSREQIIRNDSQSDNSPAEIAEENKPPIEPVPRNLQVEVLNGCGAAGIASRVTKYLRAQDVDVVDIGNHSNFNVKKTVLWRRTDKEEAAPKIAELLGVTRENIDSKIDPSLQLDVTIILGADYQTLKPFKK